MTHTFTKTPTPHHALDRAAVTVIIESDNLHETVRAFADYLRACGHQFGKLSMLVTTDLTQTITLP